MIIHKAAKKSDFNKGNESGNLGFPLFELLSEPIT
jgi:hypothetical protein